MFGPEFLADLEELAGESGVAVSSAAPGGEIEAGPLEALESFRAGVDGGTSLTEAAFLGLSPSELAERCNLMIDACRESPKREAAQAVESFVVFFQALVPTLQNEPAREVKATFFRLAPTLLQMAWAELGEHRDEGHKALRQLETLLLEVASVNLAPAESELLFRSLDQLAGLMAGGEYALATEIVATPLVGILRKNRVTRSLFRLMEVEVAVQVYLKERLGYTTPQIRMPEDVETLSDFGPIRVFEEEGLDGSRRRYLQLQLPDIPILSDVVVHLQREDGSETRDLRLDGLGSVELDVPPGLYQIGLAYTPEERGSGA